MVSVEVFVFKHFNLSLSLQCFTHYHLLSTYLPLSPSLSPSLCSGIFSYLDINKDGHIDLSEMVRGVAIFCRKPLNETLLSGYMYNYVLLLLFFFSF